jgi:hypothetical protein
MKKFISALITLLMLASAALAQNRPLQQPAPSLFPAFSTPA